MTNSQIETSLVNEETSVSIYDKIRNILNDLSNEDGNIVFKQALEKAHQKLSVNQFKNIMEKADNDQKEVLRIIIDQKDGDLLDEYIVKEGLVEKNISKTNLLEYFKTPEGEKDAELFLKTLRKEKEELLN